MSEPVVAAGVFVGAVLDGAALVDAVFAELEVEVVAVLRATGAVERFGLAEGAVTVGSVVVTPGAGADGTPAGSACGATSAETGIESPPPGVVWFAKAASGSATRAAVVRAAAANPRARRRCIGTV